MLMLAQPCSAVLERKHAQLATVRERGGAAVRHAAAQAAQLTTQEDGARRLENLLLVRPPRYLG